MSFQIFSIIRPILLSGASSLRVKEIIPQIRASKWCTVIDIWTFIRAQFQHTIKVNNTNQCFLGSHQIHITVSVTAKRGPWPILIQLQEKDDSLGASATLTIDIVRPIACQILSECSSPLSTPKGKRRAKDLCNPFPVSPPPPILYSAHMLKH